MDKDLNKEEYVSGTVCFCHITNNICVFEYMIKNNKDQLILYDEKYRQLFDEINKVCKFNRDETSMIIYKNIIFLAYLYYNHGDGSQSYGAGGCHKLILSKISDEKYIQQQIEKANLLKIKKEEKIQQKIDRKKEAINKLTNEDLKILGIKDE